MDKEYKFRNSIPIQPRIELKLPEYGCTKCKHIWTPRRPLIPVICPKCKCEGRIVKII